jgi:hypothetical protein
MAGMCRQLHYEDRGPRYFNLHLQRCQKLHFQFTG